MSAQTPLVINWKHVAKSDGYKSLKAAYIHDVRNAVKQARPMRDKKKFLRHFKWVIGRAKHYAINTGRTVDAVLNDWESKRTHWWLNYYQDSRQPKLHSNKLRPLGERGLKKRRKLCGW